MIIKIEPDKERAKSILALSAEREVYLKKIKKEGLESFPTIILENYYEIARELIISIMYLDGFKTSGEGSHKELINYLKTYKEFSEHNLFVLDEMRIKRNNSAYYGIKPNPEFISQNEQTIKEIIENLKSLVKFKL